MKMRSFSRGDIGLSITSERSFKMFRIFLGVILLAAASLAHAGDESRKGTTGADQLLIPVGARSIATGGAFLATTTGVEAIYYNPAGLAASTKSEAMFSYMSYIADINVSYFAISARVEELGTFGLSYKTLAFGDIPVTTFQNPDGTGATYSPGYFTLGLTYSRTITDRVNAGATVKFINESILSTSASGIAVDFGVQYKFQGNLALGVAIKNIGSNMKYTGTDLLTQTDVPNTAYGAPTGVYSPDTEPFQIPSYFELSLSYDLKVDEMNAFMLGATFRNNNALEDQAMVGLEYRAFNVLFLRGGYETAVKNTSQSLYGVNVGAGLEYTMENSLQVSVDYAFRSVKEFPTNNHIFTVKLGF
jgi:opacity protein-like surface antigen